MRLIKQLLNCILLIVSLKTGVTPKWDIDSTLYIIVVHVQLTAKGKQLKRRLYVILVVHKFDVRLHNLQPVVGRIGQTKTSGLLLTSEQHVLLLTKVE